MVDLNRTTLYIYDIYIYIYVYLHLVTSTPLRVVKSRQMSQIFTKNPGTSAGDLYETTRILITLYHHISPMKLPFTCTKIHHPELVVCYCGIL